MLVVANLMGGGEKKKNTVTFNIYESFQLLLFLPNLIWKKKKSKKGGSHVDGDLCINCKRMLILYSAQHSL